MHIATTYIEALLLRYYSAVLRAAGSHDLAAKMALLDHGHPLRYLTKRRACLLYADLFGTMVPKYRRAKIGGTVPAGWSRRRMPTGRLCEYAQKNLGYGDVTPADIRTELAEARRLVRLAIKENASGKCNSAED